MTTDYQTLNTNITTEIKEHLLNVDALPANTEVQKLAREITQVVFTELNTSGITEAAFKRLTATVTPLASAQGKA
jgi:hypothetical protein